MGYWQSKNGIIGDEPLDTMSDAIEEIQGQYRLDLGRDPTNDELRNVFNSSMKPLEK